MINSKGQEYKELMITEVAVKMLNVLEEFHGLGFLHRDIKPSNFRVNDGEVYLTDFGTHSAYINNNVHI
jgi:serine/threonine protein kinase